MDFKQSEVYMKKYRIVEGDREVKEIGDYKAAHYIMCNTCEQISPFAVKIDNSSTVIFMSEILSIGEENV
jgi:hypothetical protein